jgi:glutamate racemase
MNGHTAPIGVFDSGLGGLSVAQEIRALLPDESVLYAADHAYCPYGVRPADEIRARTLAIAEELRRRGVKLLVVACNTACAVALEDLRRVLPIPVVGVEPAVKPAVQVTRTGRVAVLATARTVSSPRLSGLITRFAHDTVVYTVPAPALVELVEAGETSGVNVDIALWALLHPYLDRHVDAVVLGCTHFPFLRTAIERLVGPEIKVIDSGAAVARHTRDVLETAGLLAAPGSQASFEIISTGDAEFVARIASNLIGEAITVHEFGALSHTPVPSLIGY